MSGRTDARPAAGSGLIFVRSSTDSARQFFAALGMTGNEPFWTTSGHERAKEIMRGLLVRIAAQGAVPILLNSYPMLRTVAKAVADIAAAFDQQISEDEARRFVRDCLAARPVITTLQATRKTIAGLVQAAVAPTVAGYAGMSAVDGAWSAAHARTVGRAAVAYYGGGAKGSVRALARRIAKSGDEYDQQRRRRTTLPTSVEAEHHRRLTELARSEVGCVALRYVLRRHSDLASDVYDFMAANEMTSLGEFTAQRLRLLDDESGTAARLWRSLLEELDLAALVGMVTAPAPPDAALVRRLLAVTPGDGLLVEPLNRADAYHLPSSSPAEGVLYVPHPRAARVLYPAATYHRDIFLGKVTEAVRLLAGLGARQVHIEHEDGHSADWLGSLGAPQWGAEVHTGGEHSVSGSLLLSARFPGHSQPTVPDDLLWYDYEPGWQAFGEGRIRHRQRDGRLVVSHTEDTRLDSRVSAKMVQLGLDTSVLAQLHTRQTTTWTLSAVFPED
ncbi:hypothetical protein [Paractinoplanes lichenicola]|uniref:Uncharacterized protein n=1 Tax=Paractinoplanes lichenicola TaxID=2802976 RepID=A0ABS1VMC1_9ACTN|nr:hypothetical protein [Actinoplanes lichenicola]MBL7255360.1 hypothetical protein [Actinoplanes lichenicola]